MTGATGDGRLCIALGSGDGFTRARGSGRAKLGKSEGRASLSEICPQPAGQVGAGSEFEQRLAKRFDPGKVEFSDGSLLGSGQSSKAASEQPQD